jgi:hypothetical protein
MIDIHYTTVRRGGIATALAGVLLGTALAMASPAAAAHADSRAHSQADHRDDHRKDHRKDKRKDKRHDKRDDKRNERRHDDRLHLWSDSPHHRHHDGRRSHRLAGPDGGRQSNWLAPAVVASESGASSALGIRASLGDSVDIAEGRAAYPGDRTEDKLAAVTLGEAGTATTVTATATGEDSSGETRAEAGVAELDIDLTDLRLGHLTSGEMRAECLAEDGMAPSGEALLTDAVLELPRVRDIALEESPAPNTTVRLPGRLGVLVLNEQNAQPDGSLTVNALHLTLNDRNGTSGGELIVGSVNCLAGTGTEEEAEAAAGEEDATAEERNARIVGAAEDARTGRALRGVIMEIVQPDGTTAVDCTTEDSGTCAVEDLTPGTYYICVANVPSGYAMPQRDEVCSGPYEAEAGQEILMDQPFGVERSRFAQP